MPKWHREPDHFAHAGLFLGVIAEGLRSEIRQVAEGHEVIRQEMREFREEVKEELKEIKAEVL